MIITLQVSINSFITIPFKTAVAKSDDGFKPVTYFLVRCEMASIATAHMLSVIPDSADDYADELIEEVWGTVVTCIDLTFAKGRKVDIEQVLNAAFFACGMQPELSDEFDKLVFAVLKTNALLYCEGASS